ncbi:type II secretion system GspH family protein [Patescibacteria group bacterium]|nr:type II secretion system GspH family protein [Patescibacteria group bacterium]
MWNRIKNKSGFTLTEVMIGMMILTVAIVSSTSLLMSLRKTNANVIDNMQAYFLAQEGIEAVRSMRDTNWLNNLDFRKGLVDGDYFVARKDVLATYVEGSPVTDFVPWEFWGQTDDFGLCFREGWGYGSCDAGEEADFNRKITISNPCVDDAETGDICEDSLLVRSTVSWDEDREIYLEEKLTNWKSGAL